jgi:signal peptidase I
MSKHTGKREAGEPAKAAAQRPAQAASHWGRSARDTIEAIAIAFALAFLFKTFEAEAFVIPTGSMAPTLMGRHKDVLCPECGYHYTAGSSEEADRNGNELRTPAGDIDERYQVVECTCPICRYPMSVDVKQPDPEDGGRHPSYSGDRIWVSKVPYQFTEPRRWDVIVFRCPLEAETYFIKRLVGLPNETVQILHGDIYAKGAADADFVLQRKPPDKICAMAQVVHDNDYVSPALVEAGWPARWSATSSAGAAGRWQSSTDGRSFASDGTADGETWMRYEHRVPPDGFWRDRRGEGFAPHRAAKPQLITDFYAFNTRVLRRDQAYGSPPSALGLHWVGDLLLECEADVRSDQGTLLVDLVKGGAHFRCAIDVATGQAELSIDALPDWKRSGETPLQGPGAYRIRLANVDRQLVLWVNDRLVAFDQPTTYDGVADERPRSDDGDPGDLAPVGIGSRGAAVEVRHLRVLRDVYYIADQGDHRGLPITDFQSHQSIVPLLRADDLVEFLSTPSAWQDSAGRSAFDGRQALRYELEPDQFFVLGDNSPASADARFWYGEHYVDRSLLVGKALLIYWPHPLELPVPLTGVSIPLVPNLPEMGFIR